MKCISSGLTHKGKKRSSNQDSIHLGPEQNLFIVADGMGGHLGGDIASQMAVNCIASFFAQNPKMQSKSLVQKAILHANQQIYEKSLKEVELKGMGTTVTLLYINKNEAYIGNVGDSRTYLLSGNELFQLSKDNSLVQEKINMGLITYQKSLSDPMRNVLTRSVGVDAHLDIDIFQYNVQAEDLFLLCSDGLHGPVSNRLITFILMKGLVANTGDPSANLLGQIAKDLINTANFYGGPDNVSAVLTYVLNNA